MTSMPKESKGQKKVKSEELISRFRSKEDLYKYLTMQGKTLKNAQISFSERISSINAWYKTWIYAWYPEWGEVVSQSERSQPHGSAMLPGDLREELVLGCEERWTAGEIPSN